MRSQLGSLGIFLAVFAILFILSSPGDMSLSNRKTATIRKISSSKNKAEEVFAKIPDRCQIPDRKVPNDRILSSFLASYPGSGTRLQWELAEATTGYVTTDDTFTNGHHNFIAIKTHYPCPAGREFPGAEDIMKAVIFIRHPMDTLPAYHDIIYASENFLDTEFPKQAPLAEWLSWRDLSFARELETWRKHFTYWMGRYSASNRLVIPYEQLISRKYGPSLTIQIAEFLKRGNNAAISVETESLPCIWQKIMRKMKYGENRSGKKLRRRLQDDSGSIPEAIVQGAEVENSPGVQQQSSISNTSPDGKEPQVISVDEMVQHHVGQALMEHTGLDALAGSDSSSTTSETSTPRESLLPVQDRGRDSVRPYTESQRKEMVIVLTQLLELYQDDRVLAPLLVSYIDQVARQHEEEERKQQFSASLER